MSRTRVTQREAFGLISAFSGTLLVALWGIGTPSFWYDEAATISGATRSFSSLFALAQHVDAVHTPYYALMHLWYRIGDGSEFWMRAPSAVAVSVGVACVYMLGRMLASRGVGVVAGALFFVLPRSTWMSTEARSFAIATALVSLACLAAMISVLRDRRWVLVLYALSAALAIAVFVYSALVIGAVAVALLTVRDGTRTTKILFGLSTAAMALVAAPFGLMILGQRGQLGGIRQLGFATVVDVLEEEFFVAAPWAAVAFWILAAAAIATLLLARRRVIATRGTRRVLLSWLIVPHAAIFGISLVSGSVYQPRSLAIAAPALCVLAALAWRAAWGMGGAVVSLVLVSALAAPAYFDAREPTAKGTDWRNVAQSLTAGTDSNTAIVFVEPEAHVSQYVSLTTMVYPALLAGANDPALAVHYDTLTQLWDARIPTVDLCAALTPFDRVLLARTSTTSAARVAEVHDALGDDGFEVDGGTRETPLSTIETLRRVSLPSC